MTIPALKRCPFCHLVPVFYVRGNFWRGGCDAHLPDAVMQPVDLYEEAIKQWNNIIAPVEETLREAKS